MHVINLPQDILTDKKLKPGSVIFHHYAASVGSLNGMSVLHQNAISLVISGEKTMHFSDRIVHILDDEFHFLSAGNCLASVKLSKKKLFKSILIFFDNKTLADFYLKYEADITKIKSKLKLTSEPYISFKKDDFILNYIGSLELLFKSTPIISEEMKKIKFEELMIYLLQKYPQKILSFYPGEHKQSDDFEIRKAVEANILTNISIKELAFLCNTSLSTFKRRFARIYGVSVNKWFLQKRMEMAKNLLKHHHEKPGEIYHKVGYENHSSFSQTFKQTFGMTPTEFQAHELNHHL